MPDVLEQRPDTDVDAPVVQVYRLQWFKRPADDAADRDDEELDTCYYAAAAADQIWPHTERWLAEVADSYVLIDTEEMPLDAWVADYGGDPEDARS